MKNVKPLTAAFVQKVRKPGRYGDGRGGHGLILNVHETTGGRITASWIQRIRIKGSVTHIGLGQYPVVTLAEARATALENMRNVRKGLHPAGVPTFKEAVEVVIGIHAASWKNSGKSAAQWRASLRDYAMPKLGDKRLNEITTADVLSCIKDNWSTKQETMKRVRQRIGAVMKWAVAQGYRSDDPAGPALTAALPKGNGRRQHHKALPYAEVAAALHTIRQSGAHWSTIACFEFMTLTATRSNEARSAQWDEIDVDAGVWEIPAQRMKMQRPHRVPLSSRAIEILELAKTMTGGHGLIFPTARGKAMSDNTMSKLLREQGIGCVPHGMRTSFRIWSAEMTNIPREICELALAHVNSDKVEAAYQRSDLYTKRAKLMQSWSSYLASSQAAVREIA